MRSTDQTLNWYFLRHVICLRSLSIYVYRQPPHLMPRDCHVYPVMWLVWRTKRQRPSQAFHSLDTCIVGFWAGAFEQSESSTCRAVGSQGKDVGRCLWKLKQSPVKCSGYFHSSISKIWNYYTMRSWLTLWETGGIMVNALRARHLIRWFRQDPCMGHCVAL